MDDRAGDAASAGRGDAADGDGAVVGRKVAVKLLHAELTSDDKARARFLRELEVAKRVAPFCTAQILDADATGDRPYIVSEYVPGPSLNEHVLADGPLGGAALDRLAVGTATALAAIHQAEIIHRDFKPHNVLIGPDGPRVIDFGVARAISGSTTLTSKVIGTPSYMAPEQLQGGEIGTAADVFCWAATLAFAATGEPPFGQDSIPAVINRILHNEPELGPMSGPLRDLVSDCLSKDPAERPHARQVLMRLLGHEEAAEPAPASAPDDATAMLEVGSVLAAELAGLDDDRDRRRDAAFVPAADAHDAHDDGGFADAPGTFGERADGEPERLPTPAEWAAQNTLPGKASPASGGPLRRVLAGQSRPALLAGAAAALVAIVIVSAFLAFGGDGKGKAGRTVGDPSDSPAPSSSSPSPSYTPSRRAVEPPPSTEEDTPPPDTGTPEEPDPTGESSPPPSESPTPPPSDTSSPDPSDTPTDPDPTDEPGSGGGKGGKGGKGTGKERPAG
ncbi:protein kinase [Actinomadura sp. J1-007]|nr:protein kinase [Actinomadura sp. J1-007]